MMVVADHKMVEHHGSDVSNYVLTLVAVVSVAYHCLFVNELCIVL